MMNNRTAAAEDEQFGASLFIVGVLIWYSMGIGGMLIMQVQVRDETIEDRARRRARLFLDSLDDQTHTKQILGKAFFFSSSLERFVLQKNWSIKINGNDFGTSIWTRTSICTAKTNRREFETSRNNWPCSISIRAGRRKVSNRWFPSATNGE